MRMHCYKLLGFSSGKHSARLAPKLSQAACLLDLRRKLPNTRIMPFSPGVRKICPVLQLSHDISRPSENNRITSSTAQGGGGSFKNRKPIGEIGCCESGMAERSH